MGADLIYQNGYEELLSICQQITSHRQALAKPRIEGQIVEHIGPETSNDRLLAHLIAESLLKRIDRQLLESKNIFVEEFDIPQTTLFYSMAEAVPFVYIGHYLANQYLVEAAQGSKSVTVFDIGIGSGKQVIQLLRLLEAADSGVQSVNIIGLDPVLQNLESSGKAIDEIRPELPFRLKFYPFCKLVENLSKEDFETIKKTGGDTLLINSAFSFHHTSHPLNDQNTRTNLLKRLATLEPRLLTLVEPSSNHDTEELPKRLHHCWQHFGNVYALVDEANIDVSHKYLIKEKFFGREIRNIFGVSDYFRCERHEEYESWLLRLHRAGFKPFEYTGLSVDLPSYCQYTVSKGLVRMDYNDITIVAVMAYTL